MAAKGQLKSIKSLNSICYVTFTGVVQANVVCMSEHWISDLFSEDKQCLYQPLCLQLKFFGKTHLKLKLSQFSNPTVHSD